MSTSDYLDALQTLVDDLEDRGVGVELDDWRNADRHDHATATLELLLPESLDDGEPVTEPAPAPDQQSEQPDDEDGERDLEEDENEVFECDRCGFTSDSERGLNIHIARGHTDENDGDDGDGVWCGVCGDGPFETRTALSGHHAGAGHDGDTQVATAPPDDEGKEGQTDDSGAPEAVDDVDDDDDDDGTPLETPSDDADGEAIADSAAEGDDDTGFDDLAPKWLDEASFWNAVDEAEDLHELRAELGWLVEDGDLAALVDAAGAKSELEGEDTPQSDRCEECDTTFEGALEYQIHRTEEHGIPQQDLGYLDPGEFEALVDSCDTVGELADVLDWQSARVLRALNIYGLDDLVAAGVHDEIEDDDELEVPADD